ncbi:MAG: CotH kinase family protein [Clostridia bacterium]|nr:CotH kinase family protein [Clostridia bacterium]
MKKAVCLLLCALFLTALFSLSGCRKADGGAPFSVLAVGNDPDTRIDLWLDASANVYYLFLPADTDRSALTVLCGKNRVEIDGAALTDGEATDLFAEKNAAVMRFGDREYSLIVSQSANVPAIFIQTESGSLDAIRADKDHKESAVMTVCENGGTTLSAAHLAYMKGRGGSTWLNYEKKPYNIKFEEKTDLFGMGSAKKWALLADAQPLARIKEPAALDLAREMSFAYTPEYRHVDLYVNSEYLGLYRVCEKAEVGGQRLDIPDLGDANAAANPDVKSAGLAYEIVRADGAVETAEGTLLPGDRRAAAWENEPADIAKGYLLELTDHDGGGCGFRSPRGFHIELTSPEYATRNEASLVASLYADAEEALFSPDGKNAKGKYYTDYFDPVSFADMYILREYTLDHDAGNRSIFFYKPADGETLYAGPVWDFNATFALDYTMLGTSLNDPAALWIAANCYFSETTGTDGAGLDGVLPSLFTALYRHEDFRAVVAARWSELSPRFDEAADKASALNKNLRAASLADRLRWGAPVGDTDVAALTEFMTARKAALDSAFSADGAMLYYDAGAGEGFAAESKVLRVGDPVTLKGVLEETQEQLRAEIENGVSVLSRIDTLITPPSEAYEFAGWNTKPDGSGETYQPGDGFTVTQTTTVLWAQWKKK